MKDLKLLVLLSFFSSAVLAETDETGTTRPNNYNAMMAQLEELSSRAQSELQVAQSAFTPLSEAHAKGQRTLRRVGGVLGTLAVAGCTAAACLTPQGQEILNNLQSQLPANISAEVAKVVEYLKTSTWTTPSQFGAEFGSKPFHWGIPAVIATGGLIGGLISSTSIYLFQGESRFIKNLRSKLSDALRISPSKTPPTFESIWRQYGDRSVRINLIATDHMKKLSKIKSEDKRKRLQSRIEMIRAATQLELIKDTAELLQNEAIGLADHVITKCAQTTVAIGRR